MSGFSSIGNVGHIPTSGSGSRDVTPNSLFSTLEEREAYGRLVGGRNGTQSQELKVGKVKVEIFDLSDSSQREAYETLWKDLIEKSSRMEAIVDSRKDLVQRPDGTPYWMKYVEYVEIGSREESKEKQEESGNGR